MITGRSFLACGALGVVISGCSSEGTGPSDETTGVTTVDDTPKPSFPGSATPTRTTPDAMNSAPSATRPAAASTSLSPVGMENGNEGAGVSTPTEGSTGAGSQGGGGTSAVGTTGAGMGGTDSGSAGGAAGTSGESGGAAGSSPSGEGGGTSEGSGGAANGGSGGDAGEAVEQPASCAPGRPHESGRTSVDIQHDGNDRNYVLFVPSGYDGTAPLPLVVNIHGFTSFATEELDRSKWDEMGEQENFVVVAPNGMNMAWNAGGLGGGHDDVGFIRAVVEDIASDLCIDEKRVYVSGHSNGGAMTHKLGCEAADIFAAMAPICGWTVPQEACNPARPIPVAAVRSLDDSTVRYEGGGIAPSAAEDLQRWLDANECADMPTVASHGGVCNTYTDCAAGTQVMECHPAGEHNFYYATDNLLLPDTLWPFFKEFALP